MLNTLHKASKRVFCLIIEKSHLKIISLILNSCPLSCALAGKKKKKKKNQQNLPCQQQMQSTTGVQRGNTPLACKKLYKRNHYCVERAKILGNKFGLPIIYSQGN